MRKDQNGYIVVETIGTFIPFVLLIISILSLVNIVTLQSRVHYALTQAATTLSMYCYVLEVTKIANDLTTLDNKANKVTKEADEMKADINAVIAGIESLSASEIKKNTTAVANRAYSWGSDIADDPKASLQLIMNYALNEGRNAIFGELVRPLVGRYLSNGEMSGDEYLRGVRVVDGLKGLKFYEFTLFNLSSVGRENSVLINKDGDIKLVVSYEIEYTFGSLPLPFKPTLKVTQTAKTKAWLNGSGKGYW